MSRGALTADGRARCRRRILLEGAFRLDLVRFSEHPARHDISVSTLIKLDFRTRDPHHDRVVHASTVRKGQGGEERPKISLEADGAKHGARPEHEEATHGKPMVATSAERTNDGANEAQSKEMNVTIAQQ